MGRIWPIIKLLKFLSPSISQPKDNKMPFAAAATVVSDIAVLCANKCNRMITTWSSGISHHHILIFDRHRFRNHRKLLRDRTLVISTDHTLTMAMLQALKLLSSIHFVNWLFSLFWLIAKI